jgi:hypothetical protein
MTRLGSTGREVGAVGRGGSLGPEHVHERVVERANACRARGVGLGAVVGGAVARGGSESRGNRREW